MLLQDDMRIKKNIFLNKEINHLKLDFLNEK